MIDGIDGAGKGTQTQLLLTRLIEEQVPYRTLDFPQYGQPSAYFVEKYLRGEYGTIKEVGPRKASLFYALDRFDKSFQLKKWLDSGLIVISNRYTTSNIGHQAAKLEDDEGRTIFLNWLEELEYDFLHIPRPDLVICLYLPPEISQKLIDKKNIRAYTKGLKRDIHEDDVGHLQKASDRYLEAAERDGWEVIDCSSADGTGILPAKIIHEKIFAKIKDKNIL